MLKDPRGLNLKKFFGFLGAAFISVVVLIVSLDKDWSTLSRYSHRFMNLLYQGKYMEAYQYVDSSRITTEQLREISDLASHYSLGASFMEKSSSLCAAGFKPNTLDEDPKNDERLEFWLAKVNGEWKVINILVQGRPLYR